MRTSLNEIARIEKFLGRKLSKENSDAFSIRLIYDKAFKVNVYVQRQVYGLVRQYGRKCLRKEAENVHQRLFEDSAHQRFQETIHQIFNNYQ
jgi:hypothetical protein